MGHMRLRRFRDRAEAGRLLADEVQRPARGR